MTAEVAPLRAGDPARLGAYRLTGLLGEGGQGAVYLGEDEPGHRVAVKLLHARFSGDPKARARFAAEVATAKRVSAFCTARVLDSDVEGDRPYIVSEYIEGPSLSEVLASEGPRRGADLDRLAIGTMTALAAIHQAGVVHRDFKPANVLLAPDGPRVIDFGIARALDATGTMSSAAVGTPAYMAPEQISGAQVGPAADVFAWGATMAYAACGRPAFGQDSIPAVMHRILALPPDLGDMAEPLRQVVTDCLSKDPALRPASEQVLAHLLSLAGTLPQPEARRDRGDGGSAAILTQGAATAATATTHLRAQAPPPSLLKAPAEPPAPPRQPPSSSPQYPSRAQAPRPVFAPPLPAPGPPPPGGQAPGAAWPGGPSYPDGDTAPGGSGGGPSRGRPGVGVLATAGGAALVALVLVGTVVAVQLDRGREEPGSGPTTGRTGGTFQMAAPSPSPGEIDPANAVGRTGAFVVRQLFTGLTEVDPKGAVRNRLATRIVPDPSCRQWKIEFRDGTSFSDGSPVDAQAFVRGWVRAARSDLGAGGYLMDGIVGFSQVKAGRSDEFPGIKVISKNHFTVELASSNCEFPAALAEPAFMPVPEQAGEADDAGFNSRPVGNGPFVLREHTENRRISLARNGSWAFGRTRFDGVEITLGADSALPRSAYAAGQVDWSVLANDDVSSGAGGELVSRPVAFTRMLVPITARGPMKSKEAREAVSLAVDRQKLSALFGGVHKPAHGIVPSAIPGFDTPGACPSCTKPDPDRAKALAERAGLEAGTEIELSFRESPVDMKLAESVRAQLQATLGWRVQMKATPLTRFSDYYKSLASKDASGLALFAYSPDYAGAYTMLWPLLAGENVPAKEDDGRLNFSGWKNDEFDDLLSDALTTTSAENRTRLLQQAEKLALDDLALLPLLYESQVAAAKRSRYIGLEMDFWGYPTVATARFK